MSVFFISTSQIVQGQVTISGSLAHHLSKSLRIKPTQHILVSTDQQKRFLLKISQVHHDEVIGHVVEECPCLMKDSPSIHLGMALLKGDKMDWIIQKACELGVRTVTPLMTQHSVPRIQPTRTNAQITRWNRIALEAAQQSEQWKIMDVQTPTSITEFINRMVPNSSSLFLSERSSSPGISSISLPSNSEEMITLLVGPEGGWSDQEREFSEHHGIQAVSLGAGILKADTAAFVAISLIQGQLGNLGGHARHPSEGA